MGNGEPLDRNVKEFFEKLFVGTLFGTNYALVDGVGSIDIQRITHEEAPWLDSEYRFLVRGLIGRPVSSKCIDDLYPAGTTLLRFEFKHPDPWHYRLWPSLVSNVLSAEFVVKANEQGYYVPGGAGSVIVREIEELRGVSESGLWLEVLGPVIYTKDSKDVRT